MPSNKILEEKKQVVEALAAKLQSAAAGVLVKYEGITVADDTALRAALRKAGVEYTVMKNTLTGRACDIAGYGDMKQYLSGMTAIAISQDDPIAPAKIMKQYADKISTFEIKAGFVDGGILDQAGVIELAETPSNVCPSSTSSIIASLNIFLESGSSPSKDSSSKRYFGFTARARAMKTCLLIPFEKFRIFPFTLILYSPIKRSNTSLFIFEWKHL